MATRQKSTKINYLDTFACLLLWLLAYVLVWCAVLPPPLPPSPSYEALQVNTNPIFFYTQLWWLRREWAIRGQWATKARRNFCHFIVEKCTLSIHWAQLKFKQISSEQWNKNAHNIHAHRIANVNQFSQLLNRERGDGSIGFIGDEKLFRKKSGKTLWKK